MTHLHSSLPRFAKKIVWNLKYGLFGYPEFKAPHDAVNLLAKTLRPNASIIELGCGRGDLLRSLRGAGWYGHYCGMDISQYAIRDAQKRGDLKSSWSVGDIETFSSSFTWDAVCMIESFYYLRLSDVPAVLPRIMKMLNPGAFLLLRIHDMEKHRPHVEAATALYPAAEIMESKLLVIRSPISQ